MDVTSQSLNKLFVIDVQYKVPLYQRRYVWEKSDWSVLWQDILDQEKIGSSTEATHFTGPIVTRLIKGQNNRFEVIDGQQRLITFQIVFCVIRDLCKLLEFSDSDTEKTAENHIKNGEEARKLFQETDPYEKLPDPTYKLRTSEYDHTAFDAIIKREYGQKINKTLPVEDGLKEARSQLFGEEMIEDNILDAYDYFYKQIWKYIEGCTKEENHVIKESEEKSDKEKKICKLLEPIKSNFEFAQITPGDSQQAEEIFESVNATGRKLSEFDYLRNNLFLRAGDQSDTFYKNHWIFENDPHYTWSEDKLESFFQAFLMAKLGPGVLKKEAKLFDLYQKELVIDGRNVVEEFKDIENYAETYKKLDIDPEFEPRMQFYEDLKTFYTEADEESYNPVKGLEYNYYVTVIRSFIMYLQQKLQRPKDEILSVFEILESYVARSVLVDTVSNYDSYQVIRDFFSVLFLEQNEEFAIKNMMEYFANHNKRSWITNNVIKSWFAGRKHLGITWHGSLREDRQFSLRYIFYRIEKWKRKCAGREKDELSFTKKKFPSDKVSVLTFRQLTDEEAWRSLGNLTFYWKDNHDQEIKINTFTFNKKKKFLEGGRNGTLELNSEIYNEPKSEWKLEQIKSREVKLVEAFCDIWPPYPWENIDERYTFYEKVEGTVLRIKEDGVYVRLNSGVEGYVPVDQISWTRRPIILSALYKKGDLIEAKILEISKDKQIIRLSIKQMQPNPWKDIEKRYPVNSEVKGTVVKIDQSGVTLELEEGIDGVIVKKEIAWTAHSNTDPADYVSKGDQIGAKILEISKDQSIIRLSRKQMQPNPWEDIKKKYRIGAEVKGTVINTDQSGVTLELEERVGGRVENSEIAWTRDRIIPSEYFKKGDKKIETKILGISEAEQIISLSIKQTKSNNPWKDIEKKYCVGAEVKGTVRKVYQHRAIFELEPGVEGSIDRDEMVWTKYGENIVPSEIVNEGGEIEAKIVEISEKKKRLNLSIKKMQPDPWAQIPEKYEEGSIVRGKIVTFTKFGVFAELEEGVEGFIRLSGLTDKRIEKPEEVVSIGDKLDLKVIKVDPKERKIGLSLKAAFWKKFTENNKVGSVVRGKIVTFTKFGVFAELEEGVEGLIRPYDLADKRIENPEEVVSVGEELDLKIIKLDPERRQIDLSLKAVMHDLWAKVPDEYKDGAVVRGKIVELTTSDALVELEGGIKGFITRSELAGRWIENPEEVVSVGTELYVRVIGMDQDKRQIRLEKVTTIGTLIRTKQFNNT